MKKCLFFAAVAMAAAVAFSCQKNEEAPEVKGQQQTFTAVIADSPDTKISLDNTNGKTAWVVGDSFIIHGRNTSENVTVTLDGTTNTISTDGKVATFTVTLPATQYDPDKYYALYPADVCGEYESGASKYFNCFTNTNNLMLSGRYNEAASSFVFYNVSGALSFIVDGSSFGGFDQYMIVGKNNETVGLDQYNTRVVSQSSNFTFHHYSSSGEKKSITGTVVDNGTTPNFIYFPVLEEEDTADTPGSRAECVDFTNGFIIYFLKSGVITHKASTSDPVRIERQSLYALGDITSHVKTYTPPATHTSSIDTDGATALDGSGTANCYIVSGASANQVFTFKAYKGNSTADVGTVASASILWETYNDNTASASINVIEAVDFEKKSDKDYYTMVFQMPSSIHAGNALIAAKDTGGKILWSWHIWVPSSAPSSNTYGIHDTKEMMDRNLGALDIPSKDAAVPANAGFFYQWGRKDPLRTISAFDTGALATTYPANVWTTSSTQLTTENMESSPCVFIKDSNDWLSTRENTLWDETKQIHDPCPVGYKVPKYGFTSFFDYFTIANYAGWSFNEANYNFTIGKTTDPVAVFPFGHIAKNGSYNLSDSKAWIWTATYKSESEQENARAVTVASAESRSCTGQRKANGVYVRCVAE